MKVFLGVVILCLTLVSPVNVLTVDARILQQGMRGEDVRILQETLVELGHQVTVDGVFGRQTEQAVLAIQTIGGIVTDGIVGAQTDQILRTLRDSVVPYIVRAGDTLSGLAHAYGTTINQIARRNSLDNPDELFVGQRLLIPVISQAVLGKAVDVWRPSFSWPVTGRISSPYGWRIHPINNVRHFHGGIDIAVPHGTPIRAAADGKVITAGSMGNFGLGVVIDHGQGYTTWYGHCSKILVRVGDSIQAGQQIAQVGTTGVSTGPHLDFRIKIGDNTVNPLAWLP